MKQLNQSAMRNIQKKSTPIKLIEFRYLSKILPYLLFLFGLAFPSFCNAQWIRLSEITVSTGVLDYGTKALSKQDVAKLFPASSLINNDFTKYTFNGYGRSSSDFSTLSFRFANKPNKAHARLSTYSEIGFSYGSSFFNSFNYSYNDQTALDTIATYPMAGTVVLDSIYHSTIQGSNDVSLVGISIGRFWETKKLSRLKISFGLRVNYIIHQFKYGFIYQNENYQKVYSINDNRNPDLYYYNRPNLSKGQSFSGNSGYDLSFFAPFSVSFKLSQKSEFLKMFAPYYQLGVGYGLIQYRGMKALYQHRIQNSIGVRILLP